MFAVVNLMPLDPVLVRTPFNCYSVDSSNATLPSIETHETNEKGYVTAYLAAPSSSVSSPLNWNNRSLANKSLD